MRWGKGFRYEKVCSQEKAHVENGKRFNLGGDKDVKMERQRCSWRCWQGSTTGRAWEAAKPTVYEE